MKRIVIGVLFFVSFDIYAYQLVNRLQTGTIDYHLTTPGIPIGPNPNLPGQRSPANTYDANPVSIGIGTTIVSGENPFYLDIFLQTSTSAETQLNVLGYQENLSGTRSDYSIAAGYALAEAFSVFYGYKQGETDASGDKGSTAAFIARGPFLGFVYALKFQQHSISFNAAVAQLIGKIKYDINAPIVNQYSQLNTFRTYKRYRV